MGDDGGGGIGSSEARGVSRGVEGIWWCITNK